MTITIPVEFDDVAEDGELSVETCNNAEFADVRVLGREYNDGRRDSLAVFSVALSDLSAIVTALEKVRDDNRERERNLK